MCASLFASVCASACASMCASGTRGGSARLKGSWRRAFTFSRDTSNRPSTLQAQPPFSFPPCLHSMACVSLTPRPPWLGPRQFTALTRPPWLGPRRWTAKNKGYRLPSRACSSSKICIRARAQISAPAPELKKPASALELKKRASALELKRPASAPECPIPDPRPT
eukprot:366279-Chlamydomonas_euryale.AAC.11